VQLRFGQFACVRGDALLQLDGVVDRRVDPERHAFAQAVVDDGRDLRPVARGLRLTFDHRGDRQQLIGRDV
jgi:hypothetical protein